MDEVTITFSEPIKTSMNSFQAFVGTSTTAITLENNAYGSGSKTDTLVVTVDSGSEFSVADIARKITVKAHPTSIMEDTADNVLDFTSIEASH